MNKCENICGDGEIPSSPNDIRILLYKIKAELKELIETTESKLLLQDGQIAELCVHLKTNLSNSIRCLLSDMEYSRRTFKNHYRNSFARN